MEIFNAIGLEIPKGKTLNDLAEDAEQRGVASISTRPDCVLYGHCWHIGAGLEVWTILYQSETGDVFYADCRPGFRAKKKRNLTAWMLYEDEEEGEASIEGSIEDTGVNVFFQLQNLTEVSAKNFDRTLLRVAFGGLAIRAEVSAAQSEQEWKPLYKTEGNAEKEQTYWRLCGTVTAFETLRNPHSGSGLYRINVSLGSFDLEILVSQADLRGEKLRVGASLKADVWLQGHIVSQSTYHSNYEGIDWSSRPVDFWKNFKKEN